MFQIMTEEQIKAADEQTLRERVRELSDGTKIFREIRDTQQKMLNCLQLLCSQQNTMQVLLDIKRLLEAENKAREVQEARRKRRRQAKGDPLATPVDKLALSMRTRNCLSRMDIKTVEDILEKTELDFLREYNFGRRSLVELRGALETMGLQLASGR